MEINYLDYDNGNKDELDEIAVRSLIEKGAVWYKKGGNLFYMDSEFVKRINALKTPLPCECSEATPKI
jgi:hypothetical protein